jgi:LacI family transcriptional regulator, galactose operon repressor
MATIKEIAKRAGVSIGTVDRVLHNRGRFSSETADTVRQIVRELDYRPNVMARHLSRARTYRVGILLPRPEQDSGYWALPMDGIRRAERDLSHFSLGLTFYGFDRYSTTSFTQAGEALLADKPDGILMAPLRTADAGALLRKIPADTPVVFVDTDLPGVERMSYIGQDSYQSGRLAARLMELLTGNQGVTLIVAPEAENEHLDSRIRGFMDGAKVVPELARTRVEVDHDLPAFRRILDRGAGPDKAGIFVADASGHFIAEYLSGVHSGNGRRIKLIGYDLVPENRRWMEAGVIDVLLAQRPAAQGYQGLHVLCQRIFVDKSCPERIYTPIDIVFRENLRYMTDEESI